MSEAFSILSGALDEAINDTKTKKLPRNVRSIETVSYTHLTLPTT